MNRLLIFIITAFAAFCLQAQSQTIADHINGSGKATIFQPAKLNERLMPKAAAESVNLVADTDKAAATTGGYRILLFAGNNARTAQAQARSRAAQVDEKFPEYATYVSFDAPYWRLRVGDFRNYEEASAALSRMKEALPEFAKEMRLVREKITIR
ncbi:MAG: SPOR domain-containing protein [Bacteroides sp.]|nr:SPOR domain-containing protein [Bacteroides sp.]MCM1379247.1 SPOR domain-containing protein [Bacteroides sp.]MCM1445095.1 SPOR domain-containing protein [Prevotella sp.]